MLATGSQNTVNVTVAELRQILAMDNRCEYARLSGHVILHLLQKAGLAKRVGHGKARPSRFYRGGKAPVVWCVPSMFTIDLSTVQDAQN